MMMLKIQLCITGKNTILKYNQLFKIIMIFHNITVFFKKKKILVIYCYFYQINTALVSIRVFF